MNLHRLLCWAGLHWWKSGPLYRRHDYKVPYMDYCRCCGKVLTQHG